MIRRYDGNDVYHIKYLIENTLCLFHRKHFLLRECHILLFNNIIFTIRRVSLHKCELSYNIIMLLKQQYFMFMEKSFTSMKCNSLFL